MSRKTEATRKIFLSGRVSWTMNSALLMKVAPVAAILENQYKPGVKLRQIWQCFVEYILHVWGQILSLTTGGHYCVLTIKHLQQKCCCNSWFYASDDNYRLKNTLFQSLQFLAKCLHDSLKWQTQELSFGTDVYEDERVYFKLKKRDIETHVLLPL